MENIISVNRLFNIEHCQIRQSSPKREWMDNTAHKYAYRCLPMTIANQAAWDVLCPSDIEVEWDGGDTQSSLNVKYLNKGDDFFDFASSLFGYGIVTFHVDFIIRTSPNVSIYVKGPANRIKQSIQPLEGIVETFWLPFTFTMNWKFTNPGTVKFEKDEPIFSFFPIELDRLESFVLKTENITNDQSFYNKYRTYCDSRSDHISEYGSDWQKFYMQGVEPFIEKKMPNHKTKINLKKMD